MTQNGVHTCFVSKGALWSGSMGTALSGSLLDMQVWRVSDPTQTYWIRICNLAKSPNDSQAHSCLRSTGVCYIFKVSTLWFHFWFLQVYLMNRYIHTSKHTQWLSLGMFYFICAFSFLLFFMLSKYPTTNVCIHFATRKKVIFMSILALLFLF